MECSQTPSEEQLRHVREGFSEEAPTLQRRGVGTSHALLLPPCVWTVRCRRRLSHVPTATSLTTFELLHQLRSQIHLDLPAAQMYAVRRFEQKTCVGMNSIPSRNPNMAMRHELHSSEESDA